MEKIGDIINERPDMRAGFDKLVEQVMENKQVQEFIQEEKMTPEQISKSYSNFYEYIQEHKKFVEGNPAYSSKGYEPTLIMNHGYADVSYKATEELENQQKEVRQRRRVKLVGLPRTFKDIDWADVAIDDSKRAEAYKDISDFIRNFNPHAKGYYIYGDFGVGKSFIMAAMARELAKKGISTTILHFPTYAIDVRNSIKSDGVKAMIDDVKGVDVLVIDDIGAEQASSWLRDDVLQVILQYRMQEDLPTFFTSNLDVNSLEKHLAETKNANEVWPAKRVMERVRYLTKELRLQGENRRYD